MPFSTVPGFTWPGQRIIVGERNPPSKTVPLVALNGDHSAIGPGEDLSAVISGKDDDRVVRFTHVFDVLEESADAIVKLRHAGLFETIVRLAVHHRLVLGRQE